MNTTINSAKSTSSLDVVLGERIAETRVAKGFSRQELAQKIGITHQQLQKYEKGTNRVTVSRLYDIAAAIGASMDYFLSVLTEGVGQVVCKEGNKLRRQHVELMRYFSMISDDSQKDAIYNLVKTVAEKR